MIHQAAHRLTVALVAGAATLLIAASSAEARSAGHGPSGNSQVGSPTHPPTAHPQYRRGPPCKLWSWLVLLAPLRML
jgi:hypothetical protein